MSFYSFVFFKTGGGSVGLWMMRLRFGPVVRFGVLLRLPHHRLRRYERIVTKTVPLLWTFVVQIRICIHSRILQKYML